MREIFKVALLIFIGCLVVAFALQKFAPQITDALPILGRLVDFAAYGGLLWAAIEIRYLGKVICRQTTLIDDARNQVELSRIEWQDTTDRVGGIERFVRDNTVQVLSDGVVKRFAPTPSRNAKLSKALAQPAPKVSRSKHQNPPPPKERDFGDDGGQAKKLNDFLSPEMSKEIQEMIAAEFDRRKQAKERSKTEWKPIDEILREVHGESSSEDMKEL